MIFQDESLFSFLFRTQLVYGYQDFSNLFRLCGLARNAIAVKKALLPVYRRVNKKTLYKMINYTQREMISVEQPYAHLNELERFLLRGVVILKDKRFINVGFCKYCLDESYEMNGIGYLKKGWEASNYCYRHKIPISETIGASHKLSADIMMKLILGEKISPNDSFTHKSAIAGQKMTKEKGIRHFSSLYLKPCSLALIRSWVCTNQSLLSGVYSDNLWGVDTPLLQRNICDVPDEFIIKLFSNVNDDNLVCFREFIAQQTNVVFESYGIYSRDEFRFKVLKSKNINCKDCHSGKLYEGCKLRLKY